MTPNVCDKLNEFNRFELKGWNPKAKVMDIGVNSAGDLWLIGGRGSSWGVGLKKDFQIIQYKNGKWHINGGHA